MDDRITDMARSLASLEARMGHIEEGLEQVIRNQARHDQALHQVLHGTGDTPGLVVRVDRVEQWKARHSRLVMLILGAVVPLAASSVWNVLTGGGSPA